MVVQFILVKTAKVIRNEGPSFQTSKSNQNQINILEIFVKFLDPIVFSARVVTWFETSLLSNQNLIPVQRLTIDLHTRDSSFKESSVSLTSSHSDRVVGRQPEPSNTLGRHKPRVHKQTGYTGSVAVRCTDKLPFSRYYAWTVDRATETPSSSTREPCEQVSWRNHPQVHTPAIRHVVKDGSSLTSVIDPRQKSNGTSRVEFSTVREFNVTIFSTVEFYWAARRVIRSRGISYSARCSTRIPWETDVFSLGVTVQRIHSNGSSYSYRKSYTENRCYSTMPCWYLTANLKVKRAIEKIACAKIWLVAQYRETCSRLSVSEDGRPHWPRAWNRLNTEKSATNYSCKRNQE